MFTINLTLYSYHKPLKGMCFLSMIYLTCCMQVSSKNLKLLLYLKVDQQLKAAGWTLNELSV